MMTNLKIKKSVICRMKPNQYTNLAKSDYGLLMYGYYLYERLGAKGYHRISNAIRNVARLLVAFRKVTGNAMAASLDLVHVQHYDAVVEATKLVHGHKGTGVGKPSLLLMLGRCLKAIAIAKKILAIKQGDMNYKKDAKMFLELHEEEWSLYKGHAHHTMKAKHSKTLELLP